jgi:hypothetical protein
MIRANSTSVDVQDGHNLRKGHWGIDPDAKLDVYYAQRSTKPKTVTFRTDVDAISFDVEPGRDYDFIILLNGVRPCRTRISGMRRSARPEGEAALTRPAQIPFTLGADHVIHIQGTVNGAGPLDFQFDLGADTTVIYPSAARKGAKLRFDGTILNAGMGGVVTRRTSNDNRLSIGGLVWEHEQVMEIAKQGRGVDGILGFNVFEDRVIEIDYDRGVLTVHPAPPASLEGYVKGALQFRGTTPFVEATLEAGDRRWTDWLALDTGYTGAVHLNHGFWTRTGLDGASEYVGRTTSEGVGPNVVRGRIVRVPALTLGGHTLRRVPTNIEAASTESHQSTGLLGMDVLKRYNAVVDFQNNAVYLTPNGLFDVPFNEPLSARRRIAIAGIAAGAGLLLLGLLVRRLRKKRRARPGKNESPTATIPTT